METEKIGGILFADLVKQGAANLNANRKLVNDLNVFPIPDGDTGDNMFMTIASGADEACANKTDSLGQVSAQAARGMMLGARGNSGVILSRIAAGISRGLEGVAQADVATFSRALELGVQEAYQAVAVPVEGTILTVYKDAVRYAAERLGPESSLKSHLEDFLSELRRALERTPEQLDVLKEAGVVDSGGAGLLYIAEGVKQALEGEAVETSTEETQQAPKVDISLFTEDSTLKFGYCTEFLLRLQRAKVDLEHFDLQDLTDWLNANGDSVVAFRDGTVVKVHVHTHKPGDILNHCQNYGEFLTLKVENMTLQHSGVKQEQAQSLRRLPHKPVGIVSVASGEGLSEIFRSLGCDVVVDGGQSMNPSTEDFLHAFSQINADSIFVFPNNGNIIMAAKQAAELYDKAQVFVVPSKTVGEGYAAISMLDPSAGDAQTVLDDLSEIISGVVTGTVSRAIRETQIDGVAVHSGDYIGFVGDHIYLDAESRNAAAAQLAAQLHAENYDILLLICGCDASPTERSELQKTLQKTYRRTEVILLDGGQPIYDYILVFE